MRLGDARLAGHRLRHRPRQPPREQASHPEEGSRGRPPHEVVLHGPEVAPRKQVDLDRRLEALEPRPQPGARHVEHDRSAHPEVRPEERAPAPHARPPGRAHRDLDFVRHTRQRPVKRAGENEGNEGRRRRHHGVAEPLGHPKSVAVAARLRQREPAGGQHDLRRPRPLPASCAGRSPRRRRHPPPARAPPPAARRHAGRPRPAAPAGRRGSGSRPGRACRAPPRAARRRSRGRRRRSPRRRTPSRPAGRGEAGRR